jgi:hypothetical protein
MTTRQAKKILTRWSRLFASNTKPKDALRDGRLPWSWATWKEAHRVWWRACRRARRRAVPLL